MRWYPIHDRASRRRSSRTVGDPHATQTSRHGGRVEQWLCVADLLVGCTDWPRLAQVCRLERTVTTRRKTRRELAYAGTSLPLLQAGPKILLALWRGQWRNENRSHWLRDVTLDEDCPQVRTGAARQIMEALRNWTIILFMLAGEPNIAAALRRHAAQSVALIGASVQ